jgi:hypothetical protein
VLPFVIAVAGAWLAVGSDESSSTAWKWIGVAVLIVAVIVLGALWRQLARPRIAYRDGKVLFNLRSDWPIAVPVHIVEAFFIGQGPAHLPSNAQGQEKTLNLVARLSQREKDWAQRDVRPAFGNWSDGYVTIRGTWCEPLTPELVRRLNHRLKDVKTLTEQMPADAATH